MTNILHLVILFSLDQPLAHRVKVDKGYPRARGEVQIIRPPVVWAASLLARVDWGIRFALKRGKVNRLL